MKKRYGNKELLMDVLEHRIPSRIPFGEMHIASGFIEKYTGRTYKGPVDDIDFSLDIGFYGLCFCGKEVYRNGCIAWRLRL